MKEVAGEYKQDSGPENPAEDLLDKILNAHVAKLAEMAPKAPVGETIGPADIAALKDDLKSFLTLMISTMSATMATTLTYSAAPVITQSMNKMTDDMCKVYEDRLQAIMDDGISRMQAMTARMVDAVTAADDRDAEQDKKIMQALTALMKPRKKTGVVTLPNGKVEMVVTETVQ